MLLVPERPERNCRYNTDLSTLTWLERCNTVMKLLTDVVPPSTTCSGHAQFVRLSLGSQPCKTSVVPSMSHVKALQLPSDHHNQDTALQTTLTYFVVE